MSSGITRDEWVKAMDEAGANVVDDQDSVTCYEFCRLFDPVMDRNAGLRRLTKMVEMGVAVKTRKTATLEDGRRCNTTSYKLVKQEKPRGRNRPR